MLHSFIGNGGSEDKTIDGWMVTGICNGTSTGNNTTFLHNVFFMPELMAPEVLYVFMDTGHVVFVTRDRGDCSADCKDDRVLQ